MSASLYWLPADQDGTYIPTGTPSGTIASLEKAFGGFPVVLDEGALSTLRGMAAVDRGNEAWDAIAEAIELAGRIKIDARY